MVERLNELARRFSAFRSPTGRAREVAMAAALIGFAVMGFVAVRALPPGTTDDIDWALLAVVGAVGGSTTILLNAAEFRAQGRLLGHEIAWADATRISTLSSAANLLPLPGSIVVRTSSLTGRGSSLSDATTSGVVAGLAWIGSAFAAAAFGLLVLGSALIGLASALAAAALIGTSYRVSGRLAADPTRNWLELLVVETALTAVSGARFFFVLAAMGVDASGSQALALTVSGAIASAAGVFPAGIGLREGLSAGVAALVDLPASVGFVAAAIDRILGLVVLAAAAFLLLLTGRARSVGVTPDAPHRD